MQLHIIEMSDTKAKLLIEDGKPSIINALRRAMMSDVPKMAIEDVEFHLGPIRDEEGKEYESSSPLFDEIIAHRLGLLPVPTDLDTLNFRKECACGGDGCPNCTIMYSLNKRGPCTVYSRDLEPVGDSTLAIIDPDVPITRLNEGQALLIYATAEIGRGRDHVKWQAANALGLEVETTLKINKKDDVEDFIKHFKEKHPDVQPGPTMESLQSFLITQEAEELMKSGAIEKITDNNKVYMTYETDGSLKAKRVLIEALKILELQFNEFIDMADKL